MDLLVLLIVLGVISLYLSYRFYSYIKQFTAIKNQLIETQATLQQELLKEKKLVDELQNANKTISQNILEDALTGLLSRQVFADRLKQAILQSKRYHLIFAVLFLDIDGFKMINNAIGHDIGDALLKQVAERLQNCIRQVDSLCRFGGDEFTIILSQISKPEVTVFVAQRILDALAQPFRVDGHELFVTASLGIAIYPQDGEEGSVLLKNADNALQQAKSRGSNSYQFFREEMHISSQRSLILNACLRSDSIYDELFLYYQPQMDVSTNKIIGVEALLRWQHPDFGLILPHDFLILAENNGKIIPIGEWIFKKVCQQFKQWQAQGFTPQSISVNVSLRQLENPHFVFKLSKILEEANLSPATLLLEISEGALLNKMNLIEKSLHLLRRLGVRIAIDDFSSGNLSLQHLRRFPIDCLKVDDLLVQDLASNKESAAIAKMIIFLAETLHLTIIAKGVETVEQKQLLQDLGCHLMQGYLFSQPLSPEEFTHFLSVVSE